MPRKIERIISEPYENQWRVKYTNGEEGVVPVDWAKDNLTKELKVKMKEAKVLKILRDYKYRASQTANN